MYQISLAYVPGSKQVFVRDLCGADELSVNSTETFDVIRLIDRLLLEGPGSDMGPGKAYKLPVAERDIILTAIYQRIYGDKIDSTLNCRHCNAPFDLNFSLSELVRHLREKEDKPLVRYQQDGTFTGAGELHFRLPTGEDEYAVSVFPPEQARKELFNRCLINPGNINSVEALETLMENAAPLIDTNLTASCPECSTQQEVSFNIQAFLLNSILRERAQLLKEIHQIAVTYKWSHNEIIGLTRNIRKSYVNFISESDRY